VYISPNVPYHKHKEAPGNAKDLKVLEEEKWLMNTEVRYNLQKQKGLWQLTMVYISINNPFQLICRKIDAYPSEKKAKIFAQILQRGIRKDARGTLKTNKNAFNICDN